MRYFIAGGAGFIGSHLAHKLLAQSDTDRVTVYDNFTSGREWHLAEARENPRLKIVRGDIKDLPVLTEAIRGHDQVFHFASNPDIARAATEPDIDFWEGTYLTQNILEAMRIGNVRSIIYASGSGVYGDTGIIEVEENYTPMRPISTYGASKLAGEALISAYCSMYDLKAVALRFANVVGPHQTHGVAFDFILRLLQNPGELTVLGDGYQSKSYIHVKDVIEAMFMASKSSAMGFDCYNVATLDYITVRQIADIVVKQLELEKVRYLFAGGTRGWKGDVPIIRINSQKIRKLGWNNAYSSIDAITVSAQSMIADARNGRFVK